MIDPPSSDTAQGWSVACTVKERLSQGLDSPSGEPHYDFTPSQARVLIHKPSVELVDNVCPVWVYIDVFGLCAASIKKEDVCSILGEREVWGLPKG